jgi:hypothetical protein
VELSESRFRQILLLVDKFAKPHGCMRLAWPMVSEARKRKSLAESGLTRIARNGTRIAALIVPEQRLTLVGAVVKTMKRLVIIAGATICCSCFPCYDIMELNYTSYPIHATERSALGFGIDDPLHELNRANLDAIVSTTRACVESLLPLTAEEISQGECVGTPDPEIRPCLTIKTAPDWHLDCTGKEQVFGNAPNASCEAKGLTPTTQCPCEFRAIIQDYCAVITTPNMKILSGQLVTLFTGCNNGWVGRMAECSQLSTESIVTLTRLSNEMSAELIHSMLPTY